MPRVSGLASPTGPETAPPEAPPMPMMMYQKKTVAICETQPVTAEGLRGMLNGCGDLEYRELVTTLDQASQLVRERKPDVIVMDKALGIQSLLDWLQDFRVRSTGTVAVIWGVSMTEAEALRFLQAGARGIVRKTAATSSVLACLRTVAAGRSWMEDSVIRDRRRDLYPRPELTAREAQVLELVEQGYKNKDIAHELGIRPGTVKIHLKHIFEKTGVRGRYGLALNGLKDKGVLSLTA